MTDFVFDAYIADQTRELELLAQQSDIFSLQAVRGSLFLLRFNCNGLVQNKKGEILSHNDFGVALNVSPDYLRRPIEDPRHMIAMVEADTFHPNINGHAVCVGKINAGTPLTQLVFQLYEIISFQKFTPREDDALNLNACSWVRNNAHQLPTDCRPLKRPTKVVIETVAGGS